MSAIRRHDRSDEWWVDFRFQGQRIRKRSPVQTRRGAEQYERCLRNDLVADVEAGRDPFAGPPPTFAEFAERWMREYVETRNRPSGQLEKRSRLNNHILPAFGARRIDEIDQASIDSFIAAKRRAGLAPKTVNNILTVLRCALSSAHEWGILRSVPRVHWLVVPERPYAFLGVPELEQLISATRPGYWRVLITTIAGTGMRFGEAAALRWSDVDLDGEAPAVTIGRSLMCTGEIGPTKTGRLRRVPLPARTCDALRTLPQHCELVFGRPDGRPPRPQNCLRLLHRICARAGVKRVGWHALRHSYATLLCQRGVPLRNVQALLGHTTIMMTSRYAHASDQDLAQWVRRAMTPDAPGADGHQVDTNELDAGDET